MKTRDHWETWTLAGDAPLQVFLDRPDSPPLLRRALTGALPWQTRNEVAVHRLLAAPAIAPQAVAALLALGATVTVEGPDKPNTVPLEDFLAQPARGRAAALHLPAARPSLRWGYAQVARTPTDAPIVAVIAVVEMERGSVQQARLALTGVWPQPVRLARAAADLLGGPLSDARIHAVAAAVEREVAPKGDFLGSAEYRRAMAGVLTRRALEQCLIEGKSNE